MAIWLTDNLKAALSRYSYLTDKKGKRYLLEKPAIEPNS